MGSSDRSLFEELPVQERTAGSGGEVRIREAQRDQLELQVVDLDGLVSRDHRVRAVWAFVESLELSPLYD